MGWVAARRAPGSAGLRHLDLRLAHDEAVSSECRRRALGVPVGAEPRVRARRVGGRRLARHRRRRARRATTRRASCPSPEEIVVLAPLLPADGRGVRKFPADEWVRSGRRSASRCSRCVPGRSARRPRAARGRLRRGRRRPRARPDPPGRHHLPAVGRRAAPRCVAQRHASASTTDEVRAEAAGGHARARDVVCPPGDRSTRAARRHPRARPRSRGRGPVRHAAAVRPRRRRDQGQRAPRRVLARQPHRDGVQPREAQLAVDLKHPRGMEVLHRLVAECRRRAHNMRYDAALAARRRRRRRCKQVNPALIYCHTRGFDRGHRDGLPGQRPDRRPRSPASPGRTAGAPPAAGRCGASRRSATSATASSRPSVCSRRSITATAPARGSSSTRRSSTRACSTRRTHGSPPTARRGPRPHLDAQQLGLTALYRLYQTRSGWLCLAAITDDALASPRQGARPRRLLGTDERFATAAGRADARRASSASMLDATLQAAARPSGSSALDAAGVPCEISDPTRSRSACSTTRSSSSAAG